MRWPWSGIEHELKLLRLQHDTHIGEFRQLTEDNRQFTRECVTRMQLATARREKALGEVLKALEDVLAEQRAQREGLLRMLDRLPPAPGEA